ncbi:CPBP family intramembrane glutamic endopeptidase [Paenibacillus sp. SYP-B4298]|uniref:CPBP family intramembrane glutamic endopeptidase n=1 Tax=Paenibacillus sp. SYP-B4298 TaxID=2996034 RepID=UPI0022DD9A52|nr:CPBP family intramembrane glutamic endopeptidase [Paenibacillus sp. SYP-B4298]
MNSLQTNWPVKRWTMLGLSGLLLYILVQVIPSLVHPASSGVGLTTITRANAEERAIAFIQKQFGQEVLTSHAVYQSNKLLTGYLAKEKLTEQYAKDYGDRFPVDAYQVEVTSPRINSAGSQTHYYVYVHMESGAIIAWNRLGALIDEEERLTDHDQAERAVIAFAEQQGFKAAQLEVMPQLEDGSNTIVLQAAGTAIGEAQLQLRVQPVRMPGGAVQILTYKPAFKVPAAYASLVSEQDKLAGAMSMWGYFIMTALLFILSIIYAVLYRQHTSFRRGLIMTALFAIFYILINYNMADGILASFGEDPEAEVNVTMGLIVTSLLTMMLAASIYFALIAGDGLWRQMGYKLWLRFSEEGFGQQVWRSMQQGYLLALMLLGVQTIILLVLQWLLGVWSASDVTQSPYNMSMPWLFPVVAWCAAISEEAVYRLFGIGLLRKWVKNMFIASLIPSIIWAFGHVTYPLYPSSTRLIELTIIGLLFSYILMRFGFMTAVFTHAIFNTIMMCIMLLFLGSAVNIIASLVYLALPVCIAWGLRALHRRLLPG